MARIQLLIGASLLLLTSVQVNAALIDRGGGLIYDDVFDVTWLQDANYSLTSGYDDDGLMLWDEATAWAEQLDYAGFNDWRLPDADVNDDTVVTDCLNATQSACLDNEMGNLFYHHNISTFSPGPFTDISLTYYWTNTDVNDISTSAWVLRNDFGFQGWFGKESVELAAWAVHDGDIAAVPEPPALLLLATGILGLAFSHRRINGI